MPDFTDMNVVPRDWQGPVFPFPFARYVLARQAEFQSRLNEIETLLASGNVLHSPDGFSVETNNDRVFYNDLREPTDPKKWIPDVHRTPSREDIEQYDVPEKWLQEYVRANRKRFGLTRLTPPQDRGPDFRGKYKGTYAYIEVEKHWKCWIQHKHHKDPEFDEVDLLILFYPKLPPEHRMSDFPVDIDFRTIDPDHFAEWISKNFAVCSPTEERRCLARRRVLSQELNSLWIEHVEREHPILPPKCLVDDPKTQGRFFDRLAREMLPRDQDTNQVTPLTRFDVYALPAAVDRVSRGKRDQGSEWVWR